MHICIYIVYMHINPQYNGKLHNRRLFLKVEIYSLTENYRNAQLRTNIHEKIKSKTHAVVGTSGN